MKNFKRLTAAIAATLMAASLSVPMAMNVSAETTEKPITITITQVGNGDHSYTAYPIFTGTIKKDATTGNVSLESPAWANQSNAADLVNAMLANTTLCPKKEDGSYAEDSLGAKLTAAKTASAIPDPAAVAEALSAIKSNSDEAAALAKVIASTPANVGTAVNSGTGDDANKISITQDGYYVVVDTLTAEDKTETVVSSYILKVAGNENLVIDAKAALPTVDKQIEDDDTDATTGDGNGYGETADHAIGETFNFKLLATIPKNADLKEYTSYKLVFNDEMSTGITRGNVTSVTIKYGTGDALVVNDVYYNASAVQNQKWTLTINNVLDLLNENEGQVLGGEKIEIEVIYQATLNENATSYNASSTDTNATDNNNKVYLEYSNNPYYTGDGTGDDDGLGKTEEDTVYAYTYTILNKKTKNTKEGDALAGATFNLLDNHNNAILFKWDGDKKVYIPSATGNADIVSQANGTFNIIGLDAGTYTLKETVAPTGYNLAPDTEVVISATHSENTAGTPSMTLSNDSQGMNNTIADASGSSLPSTGGMGTKLFFLGGGSMAAVAGIFLITKKRMGKSAE